MKSCNLVNINSLKLNLSNYTYTRYIAKHLITLITNFGEQFLAVF